MTSSGHLLAHFSPRSPSLAEPSWSSNLTESEKTSSRNDVYVRVWSPKPCHVGLSEFFLAGVADDNPLPLKSVERWTEVSQSLVSTGLSSQNVWKPHKRVSRIVIEDSLVQEEKEHEPVIPLLLEPTKFHDIPGPRSSTVALIHDFGIVDFFKIKPNLPSGFEKQSLIHRVSTVSPITLKSQPSKPLLVRRYQTNSWNKFVVRLSKMNRKQTKMRLIVQPLLIWCGSWPHRLGAKWKRRGWEKSLEKSPNRIVL